MEENTPSRRLTATQRARATAEKELAVPLRQEPLEHLQQLGLFPEPLHREEIVDYYKLLKNIYLALEYVEAFRNFDDDTKKLVPDFRTERTLLAQIFRVTKHASEGIPFNQLPDDEKEFLLQYSKKIPERDRHSTAVWEKVTGKIVDQILGDISTQLEDVLDKPEAKNKLNDYTAAVAANTRAIVKKLKQVASPNERWARAAELIATEGIEFWELDTLAQKSAAEKREKVDTLFPSDEEMERAGNEIKNTLTEAAKIHAKRQNDLISNAKDITTLANDSLREQYIHGIAKVLRLMHAQSQEHGRDGAAR